MSININFNWNSKAQLSTGLPKSLRTIKKNCVCLCEREGEVEGEGEIIIIDFWSCSNKTKNNTYHFLGFWVS